MSSSKGVTLTKDKAKNSSAILANLSATLGKLVVVQKSEGLSKDSVT